MQPIMHWTLNQADAAAANRVTEARTVAGPLRPCRPSFGTRRSHPTVLCLWAACALMLLGSGCRRAESPPRPSPKAVQAMNRGVSLMGQYQYDAAVKAFEEACQAAPDLVEAKINLAIARFNRSQKDQQDIEQAQQLLEQVLQKDPTNARALYVKGIVLQHLGQAEQAADCFARVVQQRPEDGVAWYLLGMCKQRLGQDAEPELRRAIALRPNLASAYYRLWQCLQAAGQAEKATPYLQQFQQLRESPLAEIIELPQYNQMGELALVLPLPAQRPPPVARAAYRPGKSKVLFSSKAAASAAPAQAAVGARGFGGAAFGDCNGDSRPELFLTGLGAGLSAAPFCLEAKPDGTFAPAQAQSALATVKDPIGCAVGDFDNDGAPDLFVVCAKTNRLFRTGTNGILTEISPPGLGPGPGQVVSALWLDADHDGDLDLFVCNADVPSQLFRNNADGTFTNITASAGLQSADSSAVALLPGDVDGDRDLDLVLLRRDAPAKLFLNELHGRFRESDLAGLDIRGEAGGLLQDLNGDGHLDLLVLGSQPAELKLFLGRGNGRFEPSPTFAETSRAVGSWGPLRGFRVADLDLDGDLDIAVFGAEGHAALNDGTGRFVLQPRLWRPEAGYELAGAELCDLTGDGVPDLLVLERGPQFRVVLVPGELTPPSTALCVRPTGVRSRDLRTRSPASGYGAALTVRWGTREQRLLYTGLTGGLNQSQLSAVFGLDGARQADYLHILWPDGVAQVEMDLAAGPSCHTVAELQRKISSCPVLFAWDGTRFRFLTDFAGVGGLGYYVGPGQYAPPQPLEHIKIEPDQLAVRDGRFELRITEPMEESAYVDRLELQAIEHPADWLVFPDERLAVAGPAPTHQLWVIDRAVFPVSAVDPAGRPCAHRLREVDRLYAYAPELDRRFFGFCQPHALELDFGDQLADWPADQPVVLCINGYLEYPYSQTAYAASQARVGWQPIRIERRLPDGRWETLVPDAGALGGMARTMTVPIAGLAGSRQCRLRLSTNLELYYDQIFIGRPARDRTLVRVHALPLARAELRWAGFAREYSPDGRQPLIYDYHTMDPTAPFHVLRGAYTRYGPVGELLAEFDDRYVVMGPGDEIAVAFDATGLGALPPGMKRSFVLVSHAWCKDSDLYTAACQTLEPLPFRAMRQYPPLPDQRYPDTPQHRAYLQQYNTRWVH